MHVFPGTPGGFHKGIAVNFDALSLKSVTKLTVYCKSFTGFRYALTGAKPDQVIREECVHIMICSALLWHVVTISLLCVFLLMPVYVLVLGAVCVQVCVPIYSMFVCLFVLHSHNKSNTPKL